MKTPRYTVPVHEMGIAIEVYRACCEAVEANGGGRLQEALVAVGELSAVEPELLVHAWEAVVAGSPDEGAVLTIDWRPATQVCANCGEIGERAEGSWLRLCPRCGFPLQVSGGGELDVLQVSFEAPDSDEASTPERTAS
jgi:hydrogenase nickel incorporation protein HypA/HybF